MYLINKYSILSTVLVVVMIDNPQGEYCQHKECLNNCTFPNGICNHDTGYCTCNALYSPYNHSKILNYWQGDDCSYLTPWCGCRNIGYSFLLFVMVMVVGIWTLL